MSPGFLPSDQSHPASLGTGDENVFKGSKATICQLRQATCRRLHNDPPTRQPALAGKTSVVIRSV